MLAKQDRAEVQRLLRRVRHPAINLAVQLEALEQTASSFRDRSEFFGSYPGGDLALVRAPGPGMSGDLHRVGLHPSEILPETFKALVGRYPFSNVEMAPVTAEALQARALAQVPTGLPSSLCPSRRLSLTRSANRRTRSICACPIDTFPIRCGEDFDRRHPAQAPLAACSPWDCTER